MENKTKKKLLFVITKSNWGGAQKYVFDLATHLSNDYDIRVVLGGNSVLKEKLEQSQIKTITIAELGRDINVFKDFIVLYKLIRLTQKERPDIIHVNSSKTGGLGALAGRLCGIQKTIFTSHGWPFNEDRSFLQKKALFFFSWLTSLFSHTTITVSNKDYLLGQAMPWVKNKMTLVYNGIALPHYKNREEARKELSLPSDAFVVGTIAELHKNKGYEYLLRGFATFAKNHPEALLVSIGGGEEKEQLEKRVQEYSLEKQVRFLGFVKDASRLLSALDIFTLTSVKEGLPYVLIEAGYAGLPTIATSVGGIPEIITHEKEGLIVPPKNTEAIATALEYYYSHREIARVHGNTLKEKVMRQFSQEHMVAETKKVYDL
ncbi:MAG TPA: glycosyltransferase family 4 protein [Candidatus Paceibacterota bacterium]|nr:glycosyltransferase family 4 protein [Candidatus Paceibacterota bacterium]